MRVPLGDGFEIDDDKSRIDVAAVHRYLSIESYWAAGRPYQEVERLVREASRVVGLYHEGRLAGFCRAVSDRVSFAYLADVYVLAEFRGRGFGQALVRQTVEGADFGEAKWLLHTRDAHGVYRKVGFGEPSDRVMERPGRTPDGAMGDRKSSKDSHDMS